MSDRKNAFRELLDEVQDATVAGVAGGAVGAVAAAVLSGPVGIAGAGGAAAGMVVEELADRAGAWVESDTVAKAEAQAAEMEARVAAARKAHGR